MSFEQEAFSASITVPSRIESIRLAASFLVHTARSLNVPVADNKLFEGAIVEALNNALEHEGQSEQSSIVCELELVGRCLKIRVLDQGAQMPIAVAPGNAATPLRELSAEDSAMFPSLRPVSRDGFRGIEMELVF